MYGNDTPLTDSDDDEMAQGHGTGGFTETHLDGGFDDYGHGSGASVQKATHNHSGQYYLQIQYDEQLVQLEFDPNDTFDDLKRRIDERDDIQMTECHFFITPRDDHGDEDDDEEEETEEELRARNGIIDDLQTKLIGYNQQVLSIYWMSFELRVMDGLEFNVSLKVSQDWTIRKLKDEIEKNHSVKLQCLSRHGMELPDDHSLAHHGITKAGYTLVSRISIRIEDQTCNIATDLLICDFWDFESVLTKYLDAERRERHKNASFSFQGKAILLHENVYENKLSNSSKLVYKVDAYPINIYDSEFKANAAPASTYANDNAQQDLNAYPLHVFDYWTLSDVKKAYSKATKKPFMEKEKFLSQEREMEDDIPLWKLRIRDYEKLIIEREEHEINVAYICCECGSEVWLRRFDSVQCRQCFHSAVYKKRSTRVTQYSCR